MPACRSEHRTGTVLYARLRGWSRRWLDGSLETSDGRKERLDFLYGNVDRGGTIELRSGVAFCFRKSHALIVDLVRGLGAVRTDSEKIFPDP